jgi:hypothetical protein
MDSQIKDGRRHFVQALGSSQVIPGKTEALIWVPPPNRRSRVVRSVSQEFEVLALAGGTTPWPRFSRGAFSGNANHFLFFAF